MFLVSTHQLLVTYSFLKRSSVFHPALFHKAVQARHITEDEQRQQGLFIIETTSEVCSCSGGNGKRGMAVFFGQRSARCSIEAGTLKGPLVS